MIEISITEAFVIYSFIIAISGIVLWGLSELGARRIYTEFKSQNVWECNYCAFVYLDTEAEEISLCPRCHSYNVVSNIPIQQKQEELQNSEPRRNPSHKKHPHARHRGPRRRR